MVFDYTIRGGPCLNTHSHITLDSSDIICYVGRDKHENEYLIKYGWPGDIWFHVEGLSSAHVYFRIQNQDKLEPIPIDDLPQDSVYDMMQIVKNNSIQGCKLASCKIVYTPHSNLKKTFEMDSGTVTYHNTKLCRYDRCDKDRLRIKELEKSKTERNNVDFFAEMKGNERRIIERKRRNRKTEMDNTTLYDPMLDDLKTTKLKLKREGDEQSGLDQAVAALEGLSFSSEQVAPAVSEDVDLQPPQEDPLWVQEANSRSLESSEKVRFLRERGYSSDDAKGAIDPTQSHVYALSKLWNQGTVPPSKEVTPELIQARQEEKEVLLAIFGEDDDSVKFSNDETLLDSVFPITSYEPPERYGLPPPLLLEVYLDHGISAYPNEPPVLAVIGGGLSEALLLELTNRLRPEAQTRAEEEAGDPQIFNLLTFLGEEVEKIVEEETAALQVIQKQKREQARKARAEAAKKRAEEEAQEKKEDALPTSFQSEMERRAYAQEVLSKGADYAKVEDGAKAQGAGVKRYNTGVSDQSLIEDLFG